MSSVNIKKVQIAFCSTAFNDEKAILTTVVSAFCCQHLDDYVCDGLCLIVSIAK